MSDEVTSMDNGRPLPQSASTTQAWWSNERTRMKPDRHVEPVRRYNMRMAFLRWPAWTVVVFVAGLMACHYLL